MLMGNPLPTQERPHGSNSEFPWDDFDCLFIGGDDAFKESGLIRRTCSPVSYTNTLPSVITPSTSKTKVLIDLNFSSTLMSLV